MTAVMQCYWQRWRRVSYVVAAPRSGVVDSLTAACRIPSNERTSSRDLTISWMRTRQTSDLHHCGWLTQKLCKGLGYGLFLNRTDALPIALFILSYSWLPAHQACRSKWIPTNLPAQKKPSS